MEIIELSYLEEIKIKTFIFKVISKEKIDNYWVKIDYNYYDDLNDLKRDFFALVKRGYFSSIEEMFNNYQIVKDNENLYLIKK